MDTKQTGPVDVLAVMDEHIADCERDLRNSETAKFEAVCAKSLDQARAVRAAVAELIEAAKEYRKQYGWQGSPWQERAAIRLDAALTAIGSAS